MATPSLGGPEARWAVIDNKSLITKSIWSRGCVCPWRGSIQLQLGKPRVQMKLRTYPVAFALPGCQGRSWRGPTFCRNKAEGKKARLGRSCHCLPVERKRPKRRPGFRATSCVHSEVGQISGVFHLCGSPPQKAFVCMQPEVLRHQILMEMSKERTTSILQEKLSAREQQCGCCNPQND